MDGPNDSMLKVDEPLQPKYELQPSEMQWLFSRISVVDRDRVLAESKKCAWYMFLTRGVPVTAFVVGSLAYGRMKWPNIKRLGFKNDVLYFSMLSCATLFAANLLSFTTCVERMQPTLVELYKKYDEIEPGESRFTYDEIRRKKRYPYTIDYPWK